MATAAARRLAICGLAELCLRGGLAWMQSFKFDEPAIDSKVFSRHPSRGESLLKALANCAPREPRQSGGGSNGPFVVFDDKASQSILDDFGHGTSIKGNDRRSAGHCFNQHESERFRPSDRRQQCNGAAEKARFFAITDL